MMRRQTIRQAVFALLPVLLLSVLLTACAGDPYRDYDPYPEAIQRPHPAPQFAGVPHTDRNGDMRDRFDVGRSFFPLALSGALVDYNLGLNRGFHTAFLANFNAVVADPEQPLEARLVAAEGSRVQLLQSQRDVAHAALLDASSAVVVAMPRDPTAWDSFAATARQNRNRPFWAMLPAYAKSHERLLNPQEARVLAWGAIIAGASGLVWQGEDNYAARNAGALGITAQPRLDYGIRTGTITPLVVTPEAAAMARRLWDAVAQMNRRFARLAPALLQPDAGTAYSVAVQSRSRDAAPMLRTLLKAHDGGYLLIVVNLAPQAEAYRIALSFRKIARVDDDASVEQDAERGLFVDRIESYGVQLYRIAP